ncbi:ExeM/NucH family extracellular endonuclease [Nocardioides sp. MAHUQ-72]|uniref:ExeM/NucH family extracellular endonuclease n=1 Tax=unclassified Nocardioides TaxID=2615069 RepID=UPI003606F304
MPSSRKGVAATLGLGLTLAGLAVTAPALANIAGSGLVISEAYGGGGNSGATYTHDFVELYNPTSAPISVDGMSVQYRSSGSTSAASGVTALTGSVPAGGHYLVQEAKGSGGTTALPQPDATGSIAMAGSAFTVWLADGTTALNPPAGAAQGTAGVVDLVGVDSNTFETTKAAAVANATSTQRAASGADTDVNSADLATAAPTPQGSGGGPVDPPPSTPVERTIAEIQGTGAASPVAGQDVVTRGVVTAAYPAGGFYGYVLQTPGTGSATDATPGASDGVYVYQPSGAVTVAPGDYVEVTGKVSEFGDPAKGGTLTELTVPGTAVKDLGAAPAPVTPLATDLPASAADREAHESELLDVSGQHFTVTNNYSTNQYAEIGLATGDTPLVAPTETTDAQDTAAIAAATAANAARAITLDDGASTNFLPFGGGPAQDIPLPWLGTDNPVRVSSAATFHEPVVLDFRNNTWKLQPTHQVTDEGRDVVTFSDTRSENAAPQDVGGDLRLATFNVLNYFNTTGVDYVAAGGSCTFYDDRDDNHVTNRDCGDTGPRGAAEDDDLQRQRDKIVTAINTLDADIVSLEEIENSVALGEADRDDALASLVDALNAAAGSTRWAYAPSPDAADLPPLAEQDVIRTAFIYDPATVDLVGPSKVLTGSTAFHNARQPLAQTFKPKGANDATTFGVIVNHFKSKGSGTDDGTGQGNANPDRVAQAEALSTFADDFKAERGISKLFLTGDFNAYSREDPVQKLEEKGYTNLQSDTPDEWTYNFGGMDGSLDHVFANADALADVTGVDIWNINADESVAFEYSRFNYNAIDFYQADQFRASDHDPEVVGIDVPGFPAEPAEGADSSLAVKATPRTVTAGKTRVKLHVRVSSEAGTPTGTVQVVADGRTYEVTLHHGRGQVRLDRFATPGTKTVEVDYLGDEATAPSSTTIDIRVRTKPGHQH